MSEETKKEENLEEQKIESEEKSEEAPQETNNNEEEIQASGEETNEEKSESPSEEVDLSQQETEPGSQTEDRQGKEVSDTSAEQEEASSEEDDLLASLLEEAQEEENIEDKISEDLAEEEELPEREDSEEKPEEKKGNRFLTILFVAGMIVITGLLAVGGIVLWYLWHTPIEQKSLPAVEGKNLAEQEVSPTKAIVPLVSTPIGVEDRKLLVLENFLIPYQRETGEYVFVKAKVLLYFTNNHDYSAAQKKEVLWREHVYQILKNVPLYVWENPNGSKVVQKELLTYLRKKQIDGIVPCDLEINAYTLK